MKWIGVVFVIASCTGWGFMMVANERKEEKRLEQLLHALRCMENELSNRMWPLPSLFSQVSDRMEGEVGQLFRLLSSELGRQECMDAGACMDKVLEQFPMELGKMKPILAELGHSLGHFDLPGQLSEVASCRRDVETMLESQQDGQKQRHRCYRTLGICAGCALALLLL